MRFGISGANLMLPATSTLLDTVTTAARATTLPAGVSTLTSRLLQEIRLAGVLDNVPGLNPEAMRILGSFALVYLLDVDGYYCDANGTEMRLSSGDAVLVYPDLAHAYGPRPGTGWRQIYVIFEEDDGGVASLWLRGPAKTVEKHKKEFDEWVKNFK